MGRKWIKAKPIVLTSGLVHFSDHFVTLDCSKDDSSTFDAILWAIEDFAFLKTFTACNNYEVVERFWKGHTGKSISHSLLNPVCYCEEPDEKGFSPPHQDIKELVRINYGISEGK